MKWLRHICIQALDWRNTFSAALDEGGVKYGSPKSLRLARR